MKKLFTVIVTAILCVPLLLAGCKTNAAPTPPLAPGYANVADQSMGETLAAARAFYAHLQQDAAAGTFKPSPEEKQGLNDLGLAIKAAEPVYLAYHAGTGSQAAANAAILTVQQKQAAVQALGVK